MIRRFRQEIEPLLKLGPQPIQFQVGGRYYAERPVGGPEWGHPLHHHVPVPQGERRQEFDGELAIHDQQLRSRFDWLREPDPAAVATPPLFMAFDHRRDYANEVINYYFFR
jgi:hypothetical protein